MSLPVYLTIKPMVSLLGVAINKKVKSEHLLIGQSHIGNENK